jgi:hypothetical protein
MKRDFINPRTFFSSPDQEKRFLLFSRIFAYYVLVFGLLALTGWISGIRSITQLMPFFRGVRIITSLSFVLLGSSLLLSSYIRNKATLIIRDILAFIPILFGLISIYEYSNNQPTLFSQVIQLALTGSRDTIMPPTIALLIICAGLAILFSDRGRRNMFQYLVLIGSIIILPSMIEHFYGIDFIYGI